MKHEIIKWKERWKEEIQLSLTQVMLVSDTGVTVKKLDEFSGKNEHIFFDKLNYLHHILP